MIHMFKWSIFHHLFLKITDFFYTFLNTKTLGLDVYQKNAYFCETCYLRILCHGDSENAKKTHGLNKNYFLGMFFTASPNFGLVFSKPTFKLFQIDC